MQVLSVVVCKPTPLQQKLYEHFLLSNATRRLLSGSKAAGVLSAITCLKKLCNHPKLIYDTLHSKTQVRDLCSRFYGLELSTSYHFGLLLTAKADLDTATN